MGWFELGEEPEWLAIQRNRMLIGFVRLRWAAGRVMRLRAIGLTCWWVGLLIGFVRRWVPWVWV